MLSVSRSSAHLLFPAVLFTFLTGTTCLAEPIGPVAVINPAAPDPVAVGQLADFSGSSSFDSQPGATIVSWLWVFGDGSPDASGPNVEHAFSAPGEFEVTLTVTDNQSPTGAQNSAFVIQDVTAAAPEPGSLALLGMGVIMLALIRRRTGGLCKATRTD
jgi:hypothetical protein